MKNIIREEIGNAIRSLYQMIMVVNGNTLECHVIDYNQELRNISENICLFDVFCNNLYENIHPEDRENFKEFTANEYFMKKLAEKVYVSIECRIRRKDDEYFWSELIFCNSTAEDSTAGTDYLFLIRDIHENKIEILKKDAEQRTLINKFRDKYFELFEENMRDEQTGLYNRKGMNYYTDIILKKAKEDRKYLFVCVADLNGLKYLNDTYGHDAGDEAILAVSGELYKAAPKKSRLIRMGGDEFLMIAALESDSTEPNEMEVKIEKGIRNYNQKHSHSFEVGVSYGWVLLPSQEDMIDLDKYVSMADKKMYEMKSIRDKHCR